MVRFKTDDPTPILNSVSYSMLRGAVLSRVLDARGFFVATFLGSPRQF